MKIIPQILAFVATSALSAHGAAVIYESFEQTVGSLGGASGGTGIGTWSVNNTVNVETESLSYGNLLHSGNQVRLVDSPGTDAYITTTAAISDAGLLNDGSTLWFSYLWSKSAGGGSNEKTGFAFGTDALDGAFNGTNMTNSGSGLGVSGSNRSFGAAAWSGGGQPSVGTVHNFFGTNDADLYGTTQLVVGKITWGADGTADEILELYNPDQGSPESPGSIVSTVTLGAVNQTLFDTISMTARNSGGDQLYDEIRFGATYADVSPAIPEPTAALLGSLGALLLLRRRRS